MLQRAENFGAFVARKLTAPAGFSLPPLLFGLVSDPQGSVSDRFYLRCSLFEVSRGRCTPGGWDIPMACGLVLITPPETTPHEHQLVERLVQGGLQTLHVRKRYSAPDLLSYLRALSPAARRRCVLHSHHELAKATTLKGVHYRRVGEASLDSVRCL